MLTLVLVVVAAVATEVRPQDGKPEQKPTPSQAVISSAAADALVGPDWSLTTLGDSAVESQKAGRHPHMQFFPTGSVNGADGCNTFRGSYTAGDTAIAFKQLMGTLMACPGADKLDQRFRDALGRARTWKVENRHLLLLDDKGVAVARFEPKEP
jgi:heat shock protein HslJ